MGSNSIPQMKETVSQVLRGGVLLSAILVLLGLVLMLSTGDTSCPFGVPDLNWFIWGDPFFAPSHILFLGFTVLIATPVLNILASIHIFLKERDLLFAAITTLVFLILLVSFVLEMK